MDDLIAEWDARHDFGTAADLLSSAFASGQSNLAAEAAHFLSEYEDTPGPIKELVERVLGSNEPPHDNPPANEVDERVRAETRDARRRLRNDPRNALAWADLALGDATSGRLERASRAMQAALSLAPTNRLIARSAARLFVHTEEPDRALRLLRRNARTPQDPWLIAAEISIARAAKRTPAFTKVGKELVESGDWSSRSRSELAAALGTLEADSGTSRDARRLFRRALEDPTENSIAQARWVNDRLRPVAEMPDERLAESSEASAERALKAGAWQQAVTHGLAWLDDQPFSSRPALLASFAACVGLEDYNECARIAKLGLRANPQQPILLNNLAFALAKGGDPLAAQGIIEQARSTVVGGDQAAVLATEGLIALRLGAVEAGRASYRAAIEKFSALAARESALMALLFWIEEEARIDLAHANELAAELPNLDVIDEPGLVALAARTNRLLGPAQ